MAGLAGILHVNWGSFVGPNVFSVIQSAQVLIWVMVGGSTTLIGPVLGCMGLMWFTNSLGSQQVINATLVMGATLLVFVMALPSGLLPTLQRLVLRLSPALAARLRQEAEQ